MGNIFLSEHIKIVFVKPVVKWNFLILWYTFNIWFTMNIMVQRLDRRDVARLIENIHVKQKPTFLIINYYNKYDLHVSRTNTKVHHHYINELFLKIIIPFQFLLFIGRIKFIKSIQKISKIYTNLKHKIFLHKIHLFLLKLIYLLCWQVAPSNFHYQKIEDI